MSIENWLIREDLEGGVTRLVLNRPPVNALNSDFLDLLGAHLDRLQADTAVKAVILASNSKVLSAGMDLKEALGFDLKDQQAMVRGLNVNFTKLFGFPKPTIVAASGAAIAGALYGGDTVDETGGRINVSLHKNGSTSDAGANDFYIAEGIYLLD